MNSLAKESKNLEYGGMPNQGPPKGLHQYIRDFTNSVAPGNEPFFIKIEAGPEDKSRECTFNVERQIKQLGGEAVLGWKIWEWYGLMVEAEFHMLWRSSDGQLHDITPHDPAIEQVLFLPDPSLRYDGRQIDNIRRPLNKNPDIQEFIEANEAEFELMNRGDRATQHGEIYLSDEEVEENRVIHIRKAKLGLKILSSKPERNDRCRCGSGQKAKNCCL